MMDDPTTSAGHCRKCNYDLSGLPSPGACPECGTSHGNELVIEGMQVKSESLTAIIIAFILMLILAGILSYFTYDGLCCGLFLLVTAVVVLVSKLLKARTRRELGYDLRWIINEEGIRVVRGMKTQIPLLAWSGIKDIQIKRSLGPFTRNWSRLTIIRQFASVDLVRTRGQDLWITGLDPEARQRVREAILEYQDRSSS